MFCASSRCSVLKKQTLPLYYTYAIVISPTTVNVIGEIYVDDEAAYSALGSSGINRTASSFDLHNYVGNPILPLAFSSSRRLPSRTLRRMVKGRLSWRITSGLCFFVTCLHSKQPPPLRPTPSSPPAVLITSLLRPLSHHFSISHGHSVHKRWDTIL